MPGEYLFSEGSTLDLARQLPQKAMEELKAYPENVFLSTPVEDAIATLVEKYRPRIPVLDEDGVWVDERSRPTNPGVKDMIFLRTATGRQSLIGFMSWSFTCRSVAMAGSFGFSHRALHIPDLRQRSMETSF
ncbi:hypothetical protein NKI20_29310 [Mesorhizobium sp. M0830]|uniref:hypothetical protein n=1 Tax=Mesorhizobium sp. M0830 TaxID=2957008 RepID=UPI0033368BDB